jgi:hypothetical protein
VEDQRSDRMKDKMSDEPEAGKESGLESLLKERHEGKEIIDRTIRINKVVKRGWKIRRVESPLWSLR